MTSDAKFRVPTTEQLIYKSLKLKCMSKTKKLNDSSLPMVSSIADNAIITVTDPTSGQVSRAPFSVLVSETEKAMGVQRASYPLKNSGWYRICEQEETSLVEGNLTAIMPYMLSVYNTYNTSSPESLVLFFSLPHSSSVSGNGICTKVIGKSQVFPKARLLASANGKRCFELFYNPTTQNKIHITLTALNQKGVIKLLPTATAGEIPEGYSAKEFILQNVGGGEIPNLQRVSYERGCAA